MLPANRPLVRFVMLWRLLLILSLLLLPTPVLSQEATPPPETPVPTEPPTLTPPPPTEPPTPLPPTDLPTLTPTPLLTDTPSATATDLPSATPSETPAATETATSAATPETTVTLTAAPTATTEVTAEVTPETTATLGATAGQTVTPTLTASATLTPSATTAPSATATAPGEPPLTILLNESFSGGGDPFQFLLTSEHFLVASDNTLALLVRQSSPLVQITYPMPANIVIQARFKFTAGAVNIEVRKTGNSGYRLRLDTSGQVQLFRNDILVAFASLNLPIGGEWQTLRLSVIDDQVRVSVNSAQIIYFVDTAPLTPGQAAFWGEGLDANSLLVDDIQLWAQQDTSGFSNVQSDQAVVADVPGAYSGFFPSGDGMLLPGSSSGLGSDILAFDAFGYSFPTARIGDTSAGNPDWSQAKQKRVFECTPTVSGVAKPYSLCLSNQDGSGFSILAESVNAGGNTFNYYSPVFSPNGDYVAFVADRNGQRGIYARPIATPSNETIVLQNAHLPTGLSIIGGKLDWTPAVGAVGNDIYVYLDESQNTGSGLPGIWKLNFAAVLNNNRTPQQVTRKLDGGIGWDRHFAVSPSGKLVLTQARSSSPGSSYPQIVYYTPTNPPLGTYTNVINAPSLSLNLRYPVWSPDGAKLAYQDIITASSTNPYKVYVINNPDNPGTPTEFPVQTGYALINAGPFVWNYLAQFLATATPTPNQATQTQQARLTQTGQAINAAATQTAQAALPCNGTPFRNGGGIRNHEQITRDLGHTISEHIYDLTSSPARLYNTNDLIARLNKDPRLPAASRWNSIQEANTWIEDVLNRRAIDICTWLNNNPRSGGKKTKGFVWSYPNENIGEVVIRGNTQGQFGKAVRVVITNDPNPRNGLLYTILSAFPLP